MSIENFKPVTTVVTAPKVGPTSSRDFNAFVREVISDISGIAIVLNKVSDLANSIPGGRKIHNNLLTRSNDINSFDNGIDGAQLYIDTASSKFTDEGIFFDSIDNRPKTLKEGILNIYSHVASEVDLLKAEISEVATQQGITEQQKQSIGSRIFDSDTQSSPTSLDGAMQRLELNMVQMAKDVYGSDSHLSGTGDSYLSFSVANQFTTLQDIHNYSSVNNTANHDNIIAVPHRKNRIAVEVLNGARTEFTLPDGDKYVLGSLTLIINRQELIPGGVDFVENAGQQTFEIIWAQGAPESTDNMWFHYDLDIS